MKFVHLTDPHLLPEGDTLFGIDPAARLRAAVASINALVPDAAFVAITGDLTHRGDAASYDLLRDILSALAVPYRLGIGNHDDREAFRAAFPEQATETGEYVQYAFDAEDARFLMLDTVSAGKAAGELCQARLDWLRAHLSGIAGAAFVFLHHPPVNLGIPDLDDIGLRDSGNLSEILRESGAACHLFFGHVHRPASGVWRGVPFFTQRALVNQSALNFRRDGGILDNLEPPAYSVVRLDGDGSVVVNMHEFADESPRFYISGPHAIDESADPRDIDGTFTSTYIP